MVSRDAHLAAADIALVHGVGISGFIWRRLWLSALNVKYRDFRYVIPFIVQFGFFVSPVGFSSATVREKSWRRWPRTLYALNPMVGVINGFRWAH